jgi:hypothetical protein
MCDEEHIALKLKRNNSEELTVNLARDIESFFAEKYSTTSCSFQYLIPTGNDLAKVDFTVSLSNAFTRRYVGSAGYTDGHLSLSNVVRLM